MSDLPKKVGRPAGPDSIRVNIYLSVDLHNEVKEAAKQLGVSVSEVMRIATEKWLEEKEEFYMEGGLSVSDGRFVNPEHLMESFISKLKRMVSNYDDLVSLNEANAARNIASWSEDPIARVRDDLIKMGIIKKTE